MAATATARTLRKALRLLSTYYPLTLPGSVLAALAVYLFTRSLVLREPVGLFLSAVVLLLLLLLAVPARLQAARFARRRIEWHSSTPIYSRFNRQQQQIEVDGARTWWFYRMHAVLRGDLVCSSRSVFAFHKDAAATSGDRFPLPLYLPFSGVLHCRCHLLVRDLFGLVRAGFGPRFSRTIAIRPPILTRQDLPTVYAAGGERETSRTKSPEEERYYMREYVPGDRFRDVNWKASARISEIYTRISPLTQDQTQIITVYLRHFRPPLKKGGESLESLVHLDFLKGWTLAFMRQVKRQQDGYQFRLVTGERDRILEGEADIDAVSAEVGALAFTPEPPGLFHDPADRLVVVFTTPYDGELPAFLQRRPQVQAHLFRTEAGIIIAGGRGATDKDGGGRNNGAVAVVDIGYALVPGTIPRRWMRLRDKPRPMVAIDENQGWTVVDRQQLAVDLFGPAEKTRGRRAS
ncbi:MAG: DUF58 domain-containing protein [Spirochaetaceae bacterium]|nr:MAG: DUF58 domain-containing protein [Spirochaetaceae bacterium]